MEKPKKQTVGQYFSTRNLEWSLWWTVLIPISVMLPWALGYRAGFADVLGWLTLFALLLDPAYSPRCHRIGRIMAAAILLIACLYLPVGVLYGPPNAYTYGSLMETDRVEAENFLSFIPKKIIVYQLLAVVASVLTLKVIHLIFKEITPPIPQFYARAKRLAVLIVLIVLFAYFVVSRLLVFADKENLLAAEDIPFPVPSMLIGYDSITAVSKYHRERAALQRVADQPAHWQLGRVAPPYQNYVLVIGESARLDYHHAFGFALENTPFLSTTDGVLIDGFTAVGTYTLSALLPILVLNGSNGDDNSWVKTANYNIISLAKTAGFETYWLSNQGFLGRYANRMSTIALSADYQYFTQRADFQSSEGYHDTALLPPLQRILNTPGSRPKLIVLHLLGSHMDFCKRLKNGVQFQYIDRMTSCYVSSIRETDQLLHDSVQLLRAADKPWSLIYFADHGLAYKDPPRDMTLVYVGEGTKEQLRVPFAKISSDDRGRTMIRADRDAARFMEAFSLWTGIETAEIAVHGGEDDFYGSRSDISAQKRLESYRSEKDKGR